MKKQLNFLLKGSGITTWCSGTMLLPNWDPEDMNLNMLISQSRSKNWIQIQV